MHFASGLNPIVVMISTMRDFAPLIKPNQVLGDHHIMGNKSILKRTDFHCQDWGGLPSI